MNADRRVTLARPDLADRRLEGIVRADRFTVPRTLQVTAPVAGLHAGPDLSAEQDDQLLFGELFDVLEVSDGWAWGQAQRDGYVGFVEAHALSEAVTSPTHWVSALRAYAFETPSIKSRAIGPYSLNALVAVEAAEDEFLLVAGVGWFHAKHLKPLGETYSDFVSVAQRFMGAPYLWGGRDSLGIDCSGLVQQALYACGRACPRDADLQETLGEEASRADLARGDLIFWSGHVGIMLDPERILHASGFHMAVAVEPLTEAVIRNEAGGVGGPTVFRRLG
jgi:cell wall-associated NlpC family hydrolase